MALSHLTTDNFDKALSAVSGIAVVDFFATWCGPCKMLAPVIEEAATELPDVSFFKVDIDEEPDLTSRYRIMSVPTLVFFKNGEVAKKIVGAISFEELEDILESL